MPLEVEDVFPGIIAYFSVGDLRRDPRIGTTAKSSDSKPRPFVCYAEADGMAYWTYLTSRPRANRLTIAAEQLRAPVGRFQLGESLIIGDCSNSFVGPAEAFAELSWRHDVFKSFRRPFLTPQGVAEVQAAVWGRGGRMPAPRRKAA